METDRQAQIVAKNSTMENTHIKNEDAWKKTHRHVRRIYDQEWKEVSKSNKLRRIKEYLYEDNGNIWLFKLDAIHLA